MPLTIRDAQFHALADARGPGLVRRLEAYLWATFPEAAAALSPAELTDLVRHAAQRARKYGFDTERQIARYLNVRMVFGPDFDTDRPWAPPILTDSVTPARIRIDWLCEKAIARAAQP